MLSADQILALAPDSSSAKAGKELAAARRWVVLGYSEQAAWGECQGSGKEPYQTQIDLAEPAFKCTCPSRKFPCKHALGLFLLLSSQTSAFTSKTPPAWVVEWLDKRAQAAQKPAKPKKESPAEPAASTDPASDGARRAGKREERVRAGLDELALWLDDLVRQGLSGAPSKPQTFWETPAARLVDAQAPGLARRVRELAGLTDAGQLLAQVGLLRLLIEGFQRIEQLPVPVQEDIRSQIGWTQEQEALLKQDGVADEWVVLGRRVEEQTLGKLGRSSFLKVQRSWLWGTASQRPALVLSFAAPGQMLDVSLVPGTSQSAELVFFPGGFPLRALVKKQLRLASASAGLPGARRLLAAHQDYVTALAANPWLDIFPMALCGVIPVQAGEVWGLRDAEGHFLPLAASFPQVWTLVALSGNQPIDVFCEWDGAALWPLSAYANGRLILLQSRGEGAAYE